MSRPIILNRPQAKNIILEEEQWEKLEKMCGRGEVSEYIRELINKDNGKLQPYIEKIKSKDKKIQELETEIKNLKERNPQKTINDINIEDIRNKALKSLIKVPLRDWTGANYHYAIKSCKFKDSEETKHWVLSHGGAER